MSYVYMVPATRLDSKSSNYFFQHAEDEAAPQSGGTAAEHLSYYVTFFVGLSYILYSAYYENITLWLNVDHFCILDKSPLPLTNLFAVTLYVT